MPKILLFPLLIFAFSCKRNFTCDCKVIDANNQILEEGKVKVRSKDSKQAHLDCHNTYLDETTQQGEVQCVVK